MRLSSVTNLLLMVLLLFIETASVSAVTPNSRLVSLVPPSAEVVAGMNAPSGDGGPKNFLLITHNNSMDLDDFIALTGRDPAREIDQVIMVAAEDGRGTFGEHSLLAIGHFDGALISRSATGANVSRYRDTPVLVVKPFPREQAIFNDVRWLAMIDSSVAVFGTITQVKQELDRYLSHSAADPLLMQRLARLRRDDDTWCVLARLEYSDKIGSALEILDAKLADFLRDGDSFEFGIHYGRRVEFEYEFNTPRSVGADAVSRSLVQSLAGRNAAESAQLPASTVTRSDRVVHGALKVSRARYDAWIEEVMARASLRVATALRDATASPN
ncbi:MAG TPA: hypothetical protein VGG59_09225 [Acidobacteriaceae bacterium]